MVELLDEAAGALVQPEDAALLAALTRALAALRHGDMPNEAIDAAVRSGAA